MRRARTRNLVLLCGTISALATGVIPLPIANCQLIPVGCSSYEPALTQLSGKLVRKVFPGPPSYESVQKGDEAEVVWLVKLDSPLCVKADIVQPDLNPEHKNVRLVQLVLDGALLDRAKSLRGKYVVASGSLFGAHTGHHRTPLLLRATYLDLPRWK